VLLKKTHHDAAGQVSVLEKTMTIDLRRAVLTANGVFLVAASLGGLCADLVGAFLLKGPQSRILDRAPHAAIGFVEAHGLALILGIWLLRVPALRTWHLTAVAIHVLLGMSNLLFWEVFVAADMLVAGYVTTALHGFFAAVQAIAAITFKPSNALHRVSQSRTYTHA
jgi:hypothetical protein